MSDPNREAVVEVRVNRIEQLFESLDPSPFLERDLDAKAVEFILNWAGVLPRDRDLALRIHVATIAADQAERAATAIRADFAYRADYARRELRETFAMGWVYLAIGVTVLVLAIMGGKLVTALLPGSVGQVIREGMMILGWVANWKPFQTFLYEWLPIWRRMRLLLRLADARIEFIETAPQGEAARAG